MDFEITLTGVRPLLMHSARLSNPLDPMAQAMRKVHSKKQKTDDDYRELAYREWLGSVYADADGPYVPGENIERMLVDSAKLTRDGQNIKRGVLVQTDYCTLNYVGPRDVETLARDENYRLMASVKVGMSRVMRCRPMFRSWQLTASGYLDESILSPDDFRAIVERAGRLVGLGDWRPRYGRFDAEVRIS